MFANSRRLAERLTAHLNELQAERDEEPKPPSTPSTATPCTHRLRTDRLSATGRDHGAVGVERGHDGSSGTRIIARAHHGSVSKEQRAQIEADLKSGQLPCVVATSSLELGIDMGAVDVVVQVEAPPSVASGLQRVGRAGHQVGATSRGVFFPNHRGDLIESAVVVERMRLGAIEEVADLRNPLDVLAQQIVAVVAAVAIGGRTAPDQSGRRAVRAGPSGRRLPASCRTARSRPSSTCSAGAIPPRTSPSCGRGWSGSATPAC